MSEAMRMWVEVAFNLAYLATVWGLVAAMTHHHSSRAILMAHHHSSRAIPMAHHHSSRAILMARRQSQVARLFILAFALLALGDTGHVGFRVLAYALGGLETAVTVLGVEVGLVGLGALSTAVTVTLFYVMMLMIWRARFGRETGWFGVVLLAAAAVRLVVMAFPQNNWNNTVPPQPWSLYRNVPLMVQGLGVAYLILRDALRQEDRAFVWVGVLILASYAFYLPVILLVQRVPWVGMLMIPKTMAYVGIAVVAYVDVFRRRESRGGW